MVFWYIVWIFIIILIFIFVDMLLFFKFYFFDYRYFYYIWYLWFIFFVDEESVFVKDRLKFVKFKFVVFNIFFNNVEFFIYFDVDEFVCFKVKGKSDVEMNGYYEDWEIGDEGKDDCLRDRCDCFNFFGKYWWLEVCLLRCFSIVFVWKFDVIVWERGKGYMFSDGFDEIGDGRKSGV